MALTTAQIISIATQIANVPGFTTQALQVLNAVLQELDQDYDFQIIRKSFNFNFSTSASGLGYAPGSGPNPMPADFLRLHRTGAFYQIFQVPYKLIGVTQEEFDTFVQQPGLASYPYLAYVDVASTPMGLYVWPPASGNYPATVRYNPIMRTLPTPRRCPGFTTAPISTRAWRASCSSSLTMSAGRHTCPTSVAAVAPARCCASISP